MIENNNITVTTTATAINEIDSQPTIMILHNEDLTDDIYLGDENVTTTNGLHLKGRETIKIEIPAGDQLFAISAKLSHPVNFLRIIP